VANRRQSGATPTGMRWHLPEKGRRLAGKEDGEGLEKYVSSIMESI